MPSNENPVYPKLEDGLREYLQRRGRGSHAYVCQHTSVSDTEVSNWLAGRRALPAHKLLEIYEWLLTTEQVYFHVSAVEVVR